MRHDKTSNESQPFKWLVALAVFMLTLGLTFSNVYGLTVPPAKTGSGGNIDTPSARMDDAGARPVQPADDPNDSGDGDGDGDDNPDPVPEPGTLILLAVGLGAAYGTMRKKM